MEWDKASIPNKGKDSHVGSDSDFEMESDLDIEMATQGSALDIEKAKDILKTLNTEVRQNGSESHGSECFICRVPNQLRNVNSKAYDPNLISIGPLHRENKGLEAMEKAKLNYFRKFTEGDRVDEKKMCDIVISIKNQEERLRNCYSEKSILMESSDDFVKMILLDAVFIILFFLESNDEKGPKNFNPRMTFDIREDLILLENQLPLFIIEEIYDQVSYHSSDNKPKSFLDLATCYLREYLNLQVVETSPGVEVETSSCVEIETSLGVEKETSLGEKRSRHFTELLRNLMFCKTSPGVEKETSSGAKNEPRHLTDLLRNLMLSGAIEPSYSFNPLKLKYSAVMLRKAGVRFQVTRDECLVNITFDNGVLKIPRLKVDHNFERRIRNIMALEQCCYPSKAYICSYMKLMDHLIDSAEDVGLLVRKGIIVHTLGDDAAVSNMINHLCEHIRDNYALFGFISRGLNAHYDNRSNLRKENLKLVYFPTIWRGTATVAAAILLILAFIQTISSVKSLL